MPKTEKKLQALMKSHYSHEIRNDVNLVDLKSVKLEDAWPFIREEIEKEIGSNQLVCVPYITEANLYEISSVFLKSDKATNGKLYKPVGKLNKIIDEERSNAEYVQWLNSNCFSDDSFKFPHESVKITLQDENIKNKVRVIMLHFSRLCFPAEKSPIKNICLSKELKGVKSVYMITDVLMAKTVEFRVNIGTSSRIFHLGNPTPLVFGFEEFNVDENGMITSKVANEVPSKGMVWNKIDPHDHLFTSTVENFALKA